jgi:hypothetical protein
MQTRGVDLCSLKLEIICICSFAHERHEEIWGERKLAHHYIGSVPILKKCGAMAYKLDLPPSLARVHNIFHVSQLKKCLKAPVDVVLPEVTPLEADLSYPEHTIKVLIRRIVSRGVKQSSSSRYNRAITLNKKQLGKVRIFSVLAIQTLNNRRKGTCACSLSL